MGDIFKDIGNAIGYASSGAQRGRESRFAGDALQNYKDLNPTITAPGAANAYGNVQLDPTGLNAAKQALGELGGVSGGHGLTEQEASALQAAQLSNAQQHGAATQAALANAARSGTLNSSRALQAVIQAGQGATNANAQAGAQAAAASANQRQQAMAELGQLGNQTSNTQAGQQFQIAQGTNQANQFNAGQNLAAQEASYQAALAKAKGQQSAYDTLIGLNQGQAGQQQQLGGELGQAAGEIGQAAATGGASLGMSGGGLFGGGGGGGGSSPTNSVGPTAGSYTTAADYGGGSEYADPNGNLNFSSFVPGYTG
jgi:hypothetical protein